MHGKEDKVIKKTYRAISWVGFRSTLDESEAAIITDDEIICSIVVVRAVSGGRRRR
jgi:hypothetical protein